MDFRNLKELGMGRNSYRLLGAEPVKRNRFEREDVLSCRTL